MDHNLRLKLGFGLRLGSEIEGQARLELGSEALGWPKSTVTGKHLGANQSQMFILKHHLLAAGLSVSYKVFLGC